MSEPTPAATKRPPGESPFSAMLRVARTAAGLTQEELAEQAGLSVRAISDLERGLKIRPHFETVRLLADALDLTPEARSELVAAARPASLYVVPAREFGIAGDNLPVQLTSFVGRECEVEEICALLRRDDVRFLTLTGPGGTGKTRLALRVVEEITHQFGDGSVFVPLASVGGPELVMSTVAQSFGIRETGDMTQSERLHSALRDRHLLLVLDNFEHLLPAATVVTDLLTVCPRLTVLVTSRASLRVSGEHLYPVPPMDLPGQALAAGAAELAQTEAIQLFAERARAVEPRFAVTASNAAAVSDICRRLDGLPLAIELAAARVNVLPPPALLARLEKNFALLSDGPTDAPGRLRSMHDAIAWSHDLLTAQEQALFRRLAVFFGGCTLEAAEAVAGDDIDVLEAVASLVGKSLLRTEPGLDGEPRYAMLETIREFGLERLRAAGEDEAIRSAHAAYYLQLAQHAEPAFYGPEVTFWFTRFETELPNLRIALESFRALGNVDDLARLASALWLFWRAHGHIREGEAWLNTAVSATSGSAPFLRAQILICAGDIAHWLGNVQQAKELLTSGTALAEEIGHQRTTALAHIFLADLMAQDGEFERSAALFAQAQLECEALNESALVAVTLVGQAYVAILLDDSSRAKELGEEGLALARACGFGYCVVHALLLLGGVDLTIGNFKAAASLYAESVVLSQSLNYTIQVVDGFARLAQIAYELGDAPRAAQLVGVTEALRETVGTPIDPTTRPDYEHTIACLRTKLGESAFDAAYMTGRTLTIEDAIAEALTVPRIGEAAPNGATKRAAGDELTPREFEVLRFIAVGRTDKEIAIELFVTRRTVTTHVQNILGKLGVDNRTAAAAWAVREGLA